MHKEVAKLCRHWENYSWVIGYKRSACITVLCFRHGCLSGSVSKSSLFSYLLFVLHWWIELWTASEKKTFVTPRHLELDCHLKHMRLLGFEKSLSVRCSATVVLEFIPRKVQAFRCLSVRMQVVRVMLIAIMFHTTATVTTTTTTTTNYDDDNNDNV